jgi:two-component system cell cycle response regulator DivK
MTRTILLVDDNHDNREIYRMFLQHSGFAVLETVHGEEGVRLAREHVPTLILRDIGMPVMNGWEALRLLRADVGTASIPVVALTAHAFPEDKHRAAEAGFDAYVTKPAMPSCVIELVQRLLAPAAG